MRTGSNKKIDWTDFVEIILMFLCMSCSPSTLHDQPSGLEVEDQVNPIGIGDITPEFSWIMEDNKEGKFQRAFQLLVASSLDKLDEEKADLWNSGKVRSDNTAFISYEGKPLKSRGLYYWKVRIWNEKGKPGSWSDPAHFEIGLLTNQDWDAKWIWRENTGTSSDYCYFRKAIELPDKPVNRARIYISICHRHELYVNGKLVGKGQNFAYPDEQYYQTFDIGPYLKSGQMNVLGVLGVHWGKGGQGRPAGSKGLLLKAVIEFNDGTSFITRSDQTLKTHQAEWIKTDIYRNGENIPYDFIDGRLHPVGWNLPDYNDSSWSKAIEISPHPVKPWINTLAAQESSVMEYEISPEKVKKIRNGHFVADFGKIYSGIPRLAFSGGKPGTLIKIKAGYRPTSGDTLRGRYQNTKMDYEYILRGGSEVFRPFWYLAFRYLEVKNAPPSFDGQSIRMIVRHNKVEVDQSSFECSDPVINGVWDLGRRSAMLSSQEQFVDTPTREQGPFNYDGYLVSIAAMKCFLERDLSQQGLKQFAQSQVRYHRETGKINASYPNGDGKRDLPHGTQSYISWAWDYYMETGDHELISEIFEQLVNVGKYNKNSENKQSGLIDWGSVPVNHTRRQLYSTGFADWIEDYDYDVTTSQRTVLSLAAYLNYVYLSRMAEVLGKKDIQEQFQQYAKDILSAVQRQLWDDSQNAYIDGLYEDGTKSKHASQQANAMTLALGLVDQERIKGAMDAVMRAGYTTGIMMIHYLIRAYGENDDDEALFRFLTDPEGRNYAYILAHDGTFCWEDWLLFNMFSDSLISESHGYGSYGAVSTVQDYILGVKPLKPQYANIKIKPHLTAELQYARGKVPTQRGQIIIDWQNNAGDGKFKMKVKIPYNVKADVYVPVKRSSGNTVKVNGFNKKGRRMGKYILFKNVRAGEYVFIR